jgi:hypothetical protein
MMTDEREGALAGIRGVMYKFHLAICPVCRRYRRQLDTTVEALASVSTDDVKPPEMDTLVAELRARGSKP